ncbi:histone H2A acetylation [Castilleja foliolosa]|uniref:Histone H2A acetylation n=1 Tax=Castilleja foliolosa TaxID=1961234 RepID=A0ABD3DJ93_9LAMI
MRAAEEEPTTPRTSRVEGRNLTASARRKVQPKEGKRSKRREDRPEVEPEDESMDEDEAVDLRLSRSSERRSKLANDRPLEPSDEDDVVDEDEDEAVDGDEAEDLGQDAGGSMIDRHLMDENLAETGAETAAQEAETGAENAAQAAERARKGKGKKKKKKADDSWRLTGAMLDGGPMISDLIPSFGGHVAVDVWKKKERGTLKIYTMAADLKDWTGFDPVKEIQEHNLLQETGMSCSPPRDDVPIGGFCTDICICGEVTIGQEHFPHALWRDDDHSPRRLLHDGAAG